MDIVDPDFGFAFGEAIYPRGGIYGPLHRQYTSLIFLNEGHARIKCDDRKFKMTSGEVGYFRNTSTFIIEYEKDVSSRASWCEGHSMLQGSAVVASEQDISPIIKITERLDSLSRLGIDLGVSSSPSLNMLRNAVGHALFMAFLHEAQVKENDLYVPKSVLRARRFMEQHFEKEITIAGLAEVANITPQHLVSSFSKHMGTTPMRYLWTIRCSRGRALLLQSGLAISEIAYQCGYKNPFHFSRHIRQRFGMSPSEIRENKGYRLSSDIAEDPSQEIF